MRGELSKGPGVDARVFRVGMGRRALVALLAGFAVGSGAIFAAGVALGRHWSAEAELPAQTAAPARGLLPAPPPTRVRTLPEAVPATISSPTAAADGREAGAEASPGSAMGPAPPTEEVGFRARIQAALAASRRPSRAPARQAVDPEALRGFLSAEPTAAELRFHRSQPVPPTPYGPQIYRAAHRHELNPVLVAAVVWAESGFEPGAVSERGARGLMQVMPDTAERFGVAPADLFDPARNLDAGARYLSWLASYFEGDLDRMLAAYNAGEGAVEEHGGVPPYPETQAFVHRVYTTLGLTHGGWRDREPGDGEPADRELADRELAEGEPANRELAEGESAEGQPADREPVVREPAGRESAGREPADRASADREPADRDPAVRESAGREPADRAPAGRDLPGPKPAVRELAHGGAGR